VRREGEVKATRPKTLGGGQVEGRQAVRELLLAQRRKVHEVLAQGRRSLLIGAGALTLLLSAAEVTTLGDGLVTVQASQTDLAGNAQTDPVAFTSFTLVTVRPTVQITAAGGTLLFGQTALISFALSESSSDFTAGDVVVTGGVLSSLSGTGASYTATFTPAASLEGTATISVFAPEARTVLRAAIIVAPVAMPSSVRITVRPRTSACGRTARNIFRRRSISASCLVRSAST
jgi:hypothetical protein